jgi:hypothetical protein
MAAGLATADGAVGVTGRSYAVLGAWANLPNPGNRQACEFLCNWQGADADRLW